MPIERPTGSVFISYAHADRQRVQQLVNQLKSRFNVFWDPGIQPGDNWFDALADHLRSARCVIALWTSNIVDSKYVTAEVMVARTRGVLIPVKLAADACIPKEFEQWQYVDLSEWTGLSARGLTPLFRLVKQYLVRPSRDPWRNALSDSDWLVPQTVQATRDLRRLTREVGTLGGVLRKSNGPISELTASLKEVHRTYAVVSDAIDQFLVPSTGQVRQRLRSYSAIESGQLIQLIDAKRGHCSRILEHYARADGVRDWLVPRAPADVLKAADDAFRVLGTADGDLFAALSRVGEALTTEATDLANLLIGGQDKVARDRMVQGRKRLLPLRRELSAAMSELQRIEASLGYVPPESRRR